MQVKFLPLDVFTQFKHDNNNVIKELRQIIRSQDTEIKRLTQQIQTLKQEIVLKSEISSQIQSLKTEISQLKSKTQIQNQTQNQNQIYKPVSQSLLSLPNLSTAKTIQEQLNQEKMALHVPQECSVVYQPIGKNLQFEQKNPDMVYQYSSFSKDISVCGDYVIFNTTKPVLLYVKTIDGKTLDVNIKPILVMFYKDKLEILEKKYLGQSWYRLNNFSLEEYANENSAQSQSFEQHVLELTVPKIDEIDIETIKNIFPNLKLIYSGFDVKYIN